MVDHRQPDPKGGSEVKAKLQALTHRVPGRSTVPESAIKRFLIACRLVRIGDTSVTVQLGPNVYEIPISAISDIEAVENPIELERSTGVDVVLTVIDGQAPMQTFVRSMVPKPEVLRELSLPVTELPFGLSSSITEFDISEEDAAVLHKRADRWAKVNSILMKPRGAGRRGANGDDTCTIREECDVWTFPIFFGPVVCDQSSGHSCNGH